MLQHLNYVQVVSHTINNSQRNVVFSFMLNGGEAKILNQTRKNILFFFLSLFRCSCFHTQSVSIYTPYFFIFFFSTRHFSTQKREKRKKNDTLSGKLRRRKELLNQT